MVMFRSIAVWVAASSGVGIAKISGELKGEAGVEVVVPGLAVHATRRAIMVNAAACDDTQVTRTRKMMELDMDCLLLYGIGGYPW
jgi:hypothetical protein